MKNLIIKSKSFLLTVMHHLGFNPKELLYLKNYARYRRNRKEWIKKGGQITQTNMVLRDYEDEAGIGKGHYFHQDLLVAKYIFEDQPKRHIDIASRLDGFVAHVASYREIEVIDIRPLKKSDHNNIKFVQADLMHPQDLGETDSLSCLHAIEHFGLGRYSDPIDVNGHIKGITNLVNLVSKGGRLYLSLPIGQFDEIHFNAHRIFKVDSILQYSSIKENTTLLRFDYVDDDGKLHTDVNIHNFNKYLNHGCGIYTFVKNK
tara:strand:- start:27 stop:806 length:780 start_codon:yes stop_codon:yes gene_type:complete